MPMLPRTFIAASLLTLAASSVGAQGVSGNWIAEFDRTVRNESGTVSGGDKAKARVALQQKGDSVIGTLQVVDAPAGPSGAAPTQRVLRGTIAGNKLSLQTEAEARRSINGEESVHKVTVLYELTLDGDKLEGTMRARSADMEMPARPFVARRDKQ